MEKLSRELIQAGLSFHVKAWLRDLYIYDEIDSTNSHLMSQARTATVDGVVCLAERQTKGRGRRGRTWLSPEGGSIAMSLGRALSIPVASVAPLSLVVGVAVADALRGQGISVSLKWPNDLLLDGRKVGGVLIELARLSSPVEVIVGIGINVGGGRALADRLGFEVGDLAEHVEVSRNQVVTEILNSLHGRIASFESHGFDPIRAEWDRLDVYRGRAVVVRGTAGEVEGVVLGVAANGELILETAEGPKEFNAGEVSLHGKQ